jgi:uncharacterized protein
MSAEPTLVEKVVQFVKEELKHHDASHGWAHIERVRNNGIHIAQKEGGYDMELVELGCLLHDVGDWKYSGPHDIPASSKVKNFLDDQGYDPIKIGKIVAIIESVSFKNELGGPTIIAPPELSVVQDADRLDAIGAVGVARTFCFTGAKGRPMYVPEVDDKMEQKLPTQEEYTNKKNESTVAHFYEKLLHLKDLMKTKTGKQIAEERHKFMEQFLVQFLDECKGKK